MLSFFDCNSFTSVISSCYGNCNVVIVVYLICYILHELHFPQCVYQLFLVPTEPS